MQALIGEKLVPGKGYLCSRRASLPQHMAAEGGAEVARWLDLASLQPRQAALLALLRATVDRLGRAGVPCWVTGGTLLGALRHGGFVPHDDDVDLECAESDAPKAQAAVEGHPRLTFRYGGHWQTTRVAHVGLRGTDVELDVFLREAPMLASRDFPSAEEVFPLRELDFHGAPVPGPAEPLALLGRLYGPDWEGTARVWSHAFNHCHGLSHDPKGKVTLPLAEYNALVASAGYQPPPPQTASGPGRGAGGGAGRRGRSGGAEGGPRGHVAGEPQAQEPRTGGSEAGAARQLSRASGISSPSPSHRFRPPPPFSFAHCLPPPERPTTWALRGSETCEHQ
ncbi:unnamed protein product, partial [Prorocentrum cordatum]